MSKAANKAANKLALQKMLVGHFIEDVPEDCNKKVCYVLQGDGLWERRRNRLGVFDTHIEEFEVPGLKKDMEEGWDLSVPLIPAKILVQIVSFFRKINNLYDSEVFVQVFYDLKTEEYVASVPEQTVSGASVNYRNDEYTTDPNKVLVFEIHSHNTMGAFFSGTDDADEKDDRFYGVIGNIDRFVPMILIRLSMGGRKELIDVEDLFNTEGVEIYSEGFPAEWISKVSKQQFMVRTYRGGKKLYVPIGSPYSASHQLSLIEDDEDEDVSETDLQDWRVSVYGDKPPEGDDREEQWNRFFSDEDKSDEDKDWPGKPDHRKINW